MTEYQPPQPQADWWLALAQHLGVGEKTQEFFQNAQANKVLEHIAQVNGDIHYILFVLLRHWIPTVLPPPPWSGTPFEKRPRLLARVFRNLACCCSQIAGTQAPY